MKKDRIVTYVLNSDHESISIITLIAMKEWGETGEYTEEEAKKVVELLQQQKVPPFRKRGNIGSYSYLTMEEWDEFVKENDDKIKKLING